MTPRGTHRDRLIVAMRELALRKGLPAATVDEVCRQAGVTKGSFYHHFASKEEMGLAAVQSYFDDVVEAVNGGAWTREPDPWERLLALVDHLAVVFSGPLLAHGCLLGVVALEAAETSEVLRRDVAAKFDQLRDAVLPAFEAAAPRLGRGIEPAGLADQLIAVVEGAIVLAKAHLDPASTHARLTLFRLLLESLHDADPVSGPAGP